MLTQKLFSEVSPIWEAYLSHPFITGLSDGTLSKEKFKYYMLQDYLYLYEYAKVFALGAVKTDDHDLMRFFSGLMDGTLNGEMLIHKAYMKRLDITDEDVNNARQALSNNAYTSYMLRIAYEGDALDILIAVLACSWSYAYIGTKLAENKSALAHPFYGEWIEGYSCDDYVNSNEALMNRINELGKNISEKRLVRLKEIFINCSRFEAMFWDMAWQGDCALCSDKADKQLLSEEAADASF